MPRQEKKPFDIVDAIAKYCRMTAPQPKAVTIEHNAMAWIPGDELIIIDDPIAEVIKTAKPKPFSFLKQFKLDIEN